MIYMEKHNKAFDKNIIKYSRKTGNNKKTDATSKIKGRNQQMGIVP